MARQGAEAHPFEALDPRDLDQLVGHEAGNALAPRRLAHEHPVHLAGMIANVAHQEKADRFAVEQGQKPLAPRRAIVLADILHPLGKLLSLEIVVDFRPKLGITPAQPIDEFPSQFLRLGGLPVFPNFLNFDHECPQMNGGTLARNPRFVSRAEAR